MEKDKGKPTVGMKNQESYIYSKERDFVLTPDLRGGDTGKSGTRRGWVVKYTTQYYLSRRKLCLKIKSPSVLDTIGRSVCPNQVFLVRCK